MHHNLLITAWLLALPKSWASEVFAQTSSAASAVCSSLASLYPNQVATNGLGLNATINYDYNQATQRYWSAANADQKPACVFFPYANTEVASAVNVLNKYPTVPFAVKAGGHQPAVGYSSTNGGLLIALETMANVTMDKSNIAHIGPGARWVDVANALDPFGRAVPTGRLGDVGTGLLLGGGLSFLSNEVGMSADSVVNFEVVTAAGQILNANQTSNSDLFYALKGGGSQFAIVTRYSMNTVPVGRVWGGTRIYGMDQKDAILNATHNLLSNYSDPKASIITTFSTTLADLVDIFVVFLFYNGPTPGAILDEFNAIKPLVDQTSANRTFGDLLNSNSQYSLYGMRYLIRGTTLPNLPGARGLDLFNYTFESWYSTAKKNEFKAIDNFVWSMAFQPVPHRLAQASVDSKNGGNCLGLRPETGDLVFMEYDVSWLRAVNDQLAATLLANISNAAVNYAQTKYAGVPPTNYKSGNISFKSYNPIFYNDAQAGQPTLQSYGAATYAKLAQIQKARDPNGFFSKRTGGFKFT